MRPYDHWLNRMKTMRAFCLSQNGTAEPLEIHRAASSDEVQAFEAQNNIRLPEPFRKTLLEFASGITFDWYFDDSHERPDFAPEWGRCDWTLEGTEVFTRAMFMDLMGYEFGDDEIYKTYCGSGEVKINFLVVPNGDMLMLELSGNGDNAPVLYVDHEQGDPAQVLAPDFVSFMDRWTLLGCIGPENWEMEPYLGEGGLDPENHTSLAWRRWCGLA